MTATNDDILMELQKITNLLQGMYGKQDNAIQIKNSSDVMATLKNIDDSLIKEEPIITEETIIPE